MSLILNATGLLEEREPAPERDSPPSCGRVCESYLQEARLIQSSLLPTGPLAGPAVEIAYRLTPFFEVGGDFVDFFHLPDGLIGLFLGDVVGKGLPAALYGALVMGTLRGIHKTGTTPRTVLSLLNERLMQRPLSARFCSTLYAAFDPHTRILTFSNAGLPLPSRASAATVNALGEGGIPSALFPAVVYDEYSVPLTPGDSVLFSTDGLQESCNREGVEFGAQRMAEVWAQCGSKSPQQSLKFLFEELSEFSQGTAPHDDITAVVLKVRS